MENKLEKPEKLENVEKKEMWGDRDSTIDENNGRMSIPAKFRDALDGGFMIARHVEKDVRCLRIYTKSAWKSFFDRLKDVRQAEKSKIMRKIGAEHVELDKQGRFCVPALLREHAFLEGELLIIGMGDTAEVWSKKEYDKSSADDMNEIAEILDKYGI